MKRRSKKLIVTKVIKSPYGIFADVGDMITYEQGMATINSTSMALPFHKVFTRKPNIIEAFNIGLCSMKNVCNRYASIPPFRLFSLTKKYISYTIDL